MDAYDGAPQEALLHRLLLRAAGLMPAQDLADARFALARGDLSALAASVVAGLRVTRGRLADDDLDLLLQATSDAATQDALRATRAPADPGQPAIDGQSDVPRYTFEPVATEDLLLRDLWIPPIVDLTGAPTPFRDAATDDIDWATATAAASLPGAVALWRTWRTRPPTESGPAAGSPTRVYLVEVDLPVADLPARTAEVMTAIGAEDDAPPLVEMHAVGSLPSAYFLAARRGAALLWAAEATRPVSIARAFDGVDPITGPFFDDTHPRLDDEERDAVLRYLEDAPVLLTSTEWMVDIFDPRGGSKVSTDHRTDGLWAWTDTVPYYLRTHGLAPDPDLLAAIRESDYAVPEVTSVGRHRAIAALFMPADGRPSGRGVRN
ncbi:hypothetical protein GCM10027280_62220 [Micromonospora polyrhachis]|uniref:Uncharacterized protein n=1 Tax=Micromonospora polyrhachis TaxID=1282883 RepID=A0A7W7WQ39_9ACTN|nr:hypothetical protein [Micromonospora polyrhachis]MBB4958878.1 hypothetical protein [Micromonospora polyrhachis]